MFEHVTGRSPRRGTMLVSALIHAALGSALVMEPLWAVEEPEPAEHPIFQPSSPVPPFEPVVIVPRGSVRSAGDPRGGRPIPTAARTPERPTYQPAAIPAELPGDTEKDGSGASDQLVVGPPGDGTGELNVPGLPPAEVIRQATAPGVDPPVALFTPAPPYPELLRRAHVHGVVILRAVIGSDGGVRDLELIRGVNPLLDKVAEDTVLTWRYKPATVAGRRVAVYLAVTISFSLR